MGFNLLKTLGMGGNAPAATGDKANVTQADIDKITAATPEEQALIKTLGGQMSPVDQGVTDATTQLGQRGEDLNNVDQAYMNRAYQPGFERLMQDYKNMDQGILENMNRRGISGGPGSNSEPEDYARMLNSRDTKEKLNQNMLLAQNQAVQQKLGQYNARLAETNQANTRRGQVFDPYMSLTSTSAADKLGAKTSLAATKAGVGAQNLQTQTGYKTSQNQLQGSIIGSVLGTTGSAMMSSDENVKKDFQPGPSPDEALNDVENIPVSRWRYQMESDDSPEHTGGMAQDMPENISPDGKSVDVISYLGTMNQAIKALSNKIGGFEQLINQGGA